MTSLPRPRRGDPAVIRSAILMNEKQLAEWVSAEESLHEDSVTQLVSTFELDAYRWARALDNRFGWDADHDLVEVLDSVLTSMHMAHQSAVREWVKYVGPDSFSMKPQAGDRVFVPGHDYGWMTVTSLRPDTAEFVGRPEGGHPMLGTTGGWVLPVESITHIEKKEVA